MGKKILKSIVVILMALIFIVLAIINNGSPDFFQNSSQEIFKYEIKNCRGIYKSDANNFFAISNGAIKFLNSNGNEKWSDILNFSEPLISHNKNILALSDMKSNSVSVYDSNGKLYSFKLNNKLLSFSVNSMGYCSCISKEKDSYKIDVYESSGRKFLTYVHSEENVFPVNANISPNGKILAINYIDTNNIEIDSKIIFMHTEQNEAFASIYEKNNFVYALNFMSDNDIIIRSEDQIISERFSAGSLKEQWRLKFEKKINMLAFNDNFFVVKLDNDNHYSQIKDSLQIYNISGRKIGEFKSLDYINFISASEKFNCILLGCTNNFIAINTKGKLLWKYLIPGEYINAAFLNKTNKILVASQNKISVFNINSKEE